MGDYVADVVVGILGSWPFAIGQGLFFALWMIGNANGWLHFDPPPWLRMNIIMSIEAAYATSFVLMSDRRQAARYKKQLHYIQSLLESQSEHNKALQVLLEDHRQLLQKVSDNDEEIAEELEKLNAEKT